MTSPKHVGATGDVNMDTGGEQRGQMAPYLLFLWVPFPIHSPLRCIVSRGTTKPTLKRNRSSAPQNKAQPCRPHSTALAASPQRALAAPNV